MIELAESIAAFLFLVWVAILVLAPIGCLFERWLIARDTRRMWNNYYRAHPELRRHR